MKDMMVTLYMLVEDDVDPIEALGLNDKPAEQHAAGLIGWAVHEGHQLFRRCDECGRVFDIHTELGMAEYEQGHGCAGLKSVLSDYDDYTVSGYSSYIKEVK